MAGTVTPSFWPRRWHTFWQHQRQQQQQHQQQATDKLTKKRLTHTHTHSKKKICNFRSMFAAFCTFTAHFSFAAQNFLTCCRANWISPKKEKPAKQWNKCCPHHVPHCVRACVTRCVCVCACVCGFVLFMCKRWLPVTIIKFALLLRLGTVNRFLMKLPPRQYTKWSLPVPFPRVA